MRRVVGKQSELGVTLIEVLIASAVFLIGMTALLHLQGSAVQGLARARNLDMAQNLASAVLEEHLLVDPATVAPGTLFFSHMGETRPTGVGAYFQVDTFVEQQATFAEFWVTARWKKYPNDKRSMVTIPDSQKFSVRMGSRALK